MPKPVVVENLFGHLTEGSEVIYSIGRKLFRSKISKRTLKHLTVRGNEFKLNGHPRYPSRHDGYQAQLLDMTTENVEALIAYEKKEVEDTEQQRVAELQRAEAKHDAYERIVEAIQRANTVDDGIEILQSELWKLENL